MYLLCIPLVAFLLPLLVIPLNQAMVPGAFLTQEVPSMVPVIINANAGTTSAVVQPFVNLETLVWSIYGIGVATALLFFMYKLARIQQWKEEGETRYVDGCYITAVHKLPTAFSFLDHIYINNAIAKAQYDQILLHEKTHVKERHSWDLLFYEFLRILFWFHPVSYLAQQDLKLVHEHIADQQTIAVHGKQSYYENLFKQALDCPDFSFANPFFKLKTIKNRIAMIQQTQNSRFPVRKLLWMLPILFASLTYTACTTDLEAVSTKEAKSTEDLPTLQGFVYGTKDYYNGVTNEEINFVDDQNEKMNQWSQLDPLPPLKDFISGKDLMKNMKIQNKIRENGSTVVIDTDNGMVLTISESPSGSVYYTGNSLDEQFQMTFEEYNAYITKLKNSTTEQKDNIEEVVEVVEVETVIERVDENTNGSEIADVPFAIIDEVPIYPGCSGTNEERKQCMQEKITAYIIKNFNTKIAKQAGLSGKQTISVQFKIGSDGYITGVMSRAKAPELQEEAARVINLLPKMKPGMQRGKEVGVIYGLPIIFEVQ
jgi:beta-lactamase regulating signal transducer with metallopeptidase domain